jgi:hypothetical protein
MKPVNRVVFKISPQVLFAITALVAGLLVFVWLHWYGERQVELIVFSVLTVLAISLYSFRCDLCLSLASREISRKHTWLGMVISKRVVRVGMSDALYLTEDIHHGKSQKVFIYHQLEVSGQLLSPRGDHPAPYALNSQTWVPNRIKLEEFAQQAAKSLRVSLQDSRKFTNRLER